MSTYLVTGGAGFIGSHLVTQLVEQGESVRVLDNLTTGALSNLAHVEGRIEFIEGDCADLPTALRAVEGVEYVLHQAAIPSVPRSVRDPLGTHDSNSRGVVSMLEASRRANVRRFVFAASSSAYGDTPTLPKKEDMTPAPLSPYAVQKLSGEYYCKVFHETHGLPTVALRYFNVFGPRQDPASEYSAVIPLFVTAALTRRPVTIFGDGEQSRDFTPVASVVQANLKACTSEAAVGRVLNVARGERMTLLELVERIGDIVGHRVEVRHGPAREGDVRHSLADISLARELLGYAPGPLLPALSDVVAWYRDSLTARRHGG